MSPLVVKQRSSGGPSTFASVSARHCCHACRHSRHFNSFCDCHLLFVVYVHRCIWRYHRDRLFDTIAWICRRKIETGGSDWSIHAFFQRGVQTGLYMLFSSVCRGKCLPIFCGGVDVYVLYASVCVRKYTHTAADRCPTHDNKKRHKFVATVNAKRRKFRHTCQFSHHFSNQSTGSRCDCVLHLKTLPRAGRSRLSTQRGANSQY